MVVVPIGIVDTDAAAAGMEKKGTARMCSVSVSVALTVFVLVFV